MTEDFHPSILSDLQRSSAEKTAALEELGGFHVNLEDMVSFNAVYYYAKENLAKVNLFLNVSWE